MSDYIKRSELIMHLSDWAFTEAPLKDDHDQNVKYDTIQTCIEAVERMKSADVVELELSPVCYKCDGKTADGIRTEKCLWLNGDNSKCIEQAHKLLYLAERKGIPSADVVERKRGKWVGRSENDCYPVCSECGCTRLGSSLGYCQKYVPFCERCGADMRELK